jgi:hypothetical protein
LVGESIIFINRSFLRSVCSFFLNLAYRSITTSSYKKIKRSRIVHSTLRNANPSFLDGEKLWLLRSKLVKFSSNSVRVLCREVSFAAIVSPNAQVCIG